MLKNNKKAKEQLHKFLKETSETVMKVWHTKKLYEFSYSLYSLSSSCYKVLRSQLPFPSQSVLRERFSPQVQQIEKRLISENSIESTLQIRQKDFDDEIITAVSNLVPKNKQNS